jgi:hypothetical protein
MDERCQITKSDVKDVREGEIELHDGTVLFEGDYVFTDPMLTITPMISRVFNRAEYRQDGKEMEFYFKRGGSICYVDVPTHIALMCAFLPSLGNAYNALIKGRYKQKGHDVKVGVESTNSVFSNLN